MNLYFYYKMLLQKNNIGLVSVTDETSQFGEFANVIQSFLMFAAEQERKTKSNPFCRRMYWLFLWPLKALTEEGHLLIQ